MRTEIDGYTPKFKARLVAKGFSQRIGYEYDSTYSPVMDATTYRILLAMLSHFEWNVATMDVVATYLYGPLHHDVYMSVPEGVDMSPSISQPCVKLNRALYGLKQSGREWYTTLTTALSRIGFKTDIQHPSVFAKLSRAGPVVVSIYVED